MDYKNTNNNPGCTKEKCQSLQSDEVEHCTEEEKLTSESLIRYSLLMSVFVYFVVVFVLCLCVCVCVCVCVTVCARPFVVVVVDRFYIALFSALEQTHCARM